MGHNRGIGHPGADRNHPDPMALRQRRARLSEINNPGFGRGIGWIRRHRVKGSDRRRVNDNPFNPTGVHQFHGQAGAQHHGDEIHVNDLHHCRNGGLRKLNGA